MLMTRPQPRADHCAGRSRVRTATAPSGWCRSRHPSPTSDRSWIGPRMLMPALLIRMSILPSADSTPAASRSTSAALVTSASKASARRPVAAAIPSADSSHAWRDRPEMAMSAPASASAVAIVRPSPRAPPVTRATRPSSRNASRTFRVFPVGSVTAALHGRLLLRGRLVPVAVPRPSTVSCASWSVPGLRPPPRASPASRCAPTRAGCKSALTRPARR